MDSNSEKNEGDSLFASSLAIPTNEINFLGKKTNSHVIFTLNSNNILNLPNTNEAIKTNSFNNQIKIQDNICSICNKNY